jgi:hypothetical protein
VELPVPPATALTCDYETAMTESETPMCETGDVDERTRRRRVTAKYATTLALVLDQDSFTFLQLFRGPGAAERAAQLVRYLVWLDGQVEALDYDHRDRGCAGRRS